MELDRAKLGLLIMQCSCCTDANEVLCSFAVLNVMAELELHKKFKSLIGLCVNSSVTLPSNIC